TPYQALEVNAFIGGAMVPRIVVDISRENLKDPFVLNAVGYRYDALLDKYHMGEQSVDFVYLGSQLPSFALPGNLKVLYDYDTWQTLANKANKHPVYTLKRFQEATVHDPVLNLILLSNDDLKSEYFANLAIDNTVVLSRKRTGYMVWPINGSF